MPEFRSYPETAVAAGKELIMENGNRFYSKISKIGYSRNIGRSFKTNNIVAALRNCKIPFEEFEKIEIDTEIDFVAEGGGVHFSIWLYPLKDNGHRAFDNGFKIEFYTSDIEGLEKEISDVLSFLKSIKEYIIFELNHDPDRMWE